MAELANLWQFELRHGCSPDPTEGACLLDAVSWMEYGHLGDHPECVCPIIAIYGRMINDLLDAATRQRLRPFIPRLIGTVDRAAEAARAEYLAWQAVRQFAAIAGDALDWPSQSKLRNATSKQEVQWAVRLMKLQYLSSRRRKYPKLKEGSAQCAAMALKTKHPITAARWAVTSLVRARYEVLLFAGRQYESFDALIEAMIATLDGVLMIGKQAEPIDLPYAEAAVKRFAERSTLRVMSH